MKSKESLVVFDQFTNIRNAKQDHRESFDSHTKREPGHSIRMVSLILSSLTNAFENSRVDHSATGYLDPAAFGMLDVDFET